MATPTTTIDALPPAALPLGPSDLIIVQQAGVTKKAIAADLAVGGGGGGGGTGGTGVTNGDKGDIIVTGSGSIWTFDNTVVTNIARTLLAATSTAQMRTTLGVPAALNGLVAVWKGTAAEYAAISPKNANTLYCVTA